MAGRKLVVLANKSAGRSENPQLTLSPSRSISNIAAGLVLASISMAVAQLFDWQSLYHWLLAIQVTCFLFCPLICSSCCCCFVAAIAAAVAGAADADAVTKVALRSTVQITCGNC